MTTTSKEFGVSGEFTVIPGSKTWPTWGGKNLATMRRSELLRLLRDFGVDPDSSTPHLELCQRLAETLAELSESRDYLRG